VRLVLPTRRAEAQFEWFKAQCGWEADQHKAERLAADEPVTVPRSYLGGRSIPREDTGRRDCETATRM